LFPSDELFLRFQKEKPDDDDEPRPRPLERLQSAIEAAITNRITRDVLRRMVYEHNSLTVASSALLT
jgi:hypothetical protein